jgi:hypothetical protein
MAEQETELLSSRPNQGRLVLIKDRQISPIFFFDGSHASMNSIRRFCLRTALLAAGLSMILLAGCSGTGSVSGVVTQANGQPLTGGIITFYPKKGNSVSTNIKPDGTYEAVVPVGECKVSVDNRTVGKAPAAPIGSSGSSTASGAGTPGPNVPGGKGGMPGDKAGEKIKERMREQGHDPTAASGDILPGTYVKIDTKYYKSDSSGLVYTITGGSQKIDIKLD